MAERSDEALLLRRIPYKDTSLILHLLTRHQGRIALMARGGRRMKSPLRAALAPLHRLELLWRPGRTGMGTLIEARRHEILLGDSAMLAGLELLAVASGLFQEGDPHGYEEVCRALYRLQQRPDAGGRCAAVWGLLHECGWIGELDHCWHCGRAAADGDTLRWRDGEMMCEQCGGGKGIPAGLRKGIAGYLQSPNVRLGQSDVSVWWTMIQDILRQHGVRQLPAYEAF